MYFQHRTILCIVIVFHREVTIGSAWGRAIKSTGWRIAGDPSFTENHPYSIACFSSCILSPSCQAADYEEETKLCRHFYRGWLYVQEASATNHIAFVRGIVGIQAGKVPRYKYSYDQGHPICASLGAWFMSEAELWNAYHAGYERCTCGWVREGGRYPMQVASVYCGSGIGLNNCDSWSFADIWCMVD